MPYETLHPALGNTLKVFPFVDAFIQNVHVHLGDLRSRTPNPYNVNASPNSARQDHINFPLFKRRISLLTKLCNFKQEFTLLCIYGSRFKDKKHSGILTK